MGARRLSGCPRPCGVGRALWRVSRLLRPCKAQPGLPPDRGDAAPRRTFPNLDHRGFLARPHRHRAAQRRAHRGHDLAGARERGARAGRRLCHDLERRHVQSAGGVAAAGRRRGPQRHRGLLRGAAQRQERVRGRPRYRRVLRPANGLGAGNPVPARPRPGGDEWLANAAARSFAHGPEGRRQGRLRPDLAVRQRWTHRDPGAGAAALCGRALCIARGGAGAGAQILRAADERGRSCARKRCSSAIPKAAISSHRTGRLEPGGSRSWPCAGT
jgi:hypothetical protein